MPVDILWNYPFYLEKCSWVTSLWYFVIQKDKWRSAVLYTSCNTRAWSIYLIYENVNNCQSLHVILIPAIKFKPMTKFHICSWGLLFCYIIVLWKNVIELKQHQLKKVFLNFQPFFSKIFLKNAKFNCISIDVYNNFRNNGYISRLSGRKFRNLTIIETL